MRAQWRATRRRAYAVGQAGAQLLATVSDGAAWARAAVALKLAASRRRKNTEDATRARVLGRREALEGRLADTPVGDRAAFRM
eukprot:135231-Alexandrium_andersonii.AAC.1